MPLHNLLKNTLPARLNHIAMTRNDAVKVPTRDCAHALVKCRTITRRRRVPDETLLPDRAPLCGIDTRKELGQEPGGGALASLAHLFCGGEVEDEVGFDKGAGGLVVEDELFVNVAVDVLEVELAVEFF